jgi:hypothetical protein
VAVSDNRPSLALILGPLPEHLIRRGPTEPFPGPGIIKKRYPAAKTLVILFQEGGVGLIVPNLQPGDRHPQLFFQAFQQWFYLLAVNALCSIKLQQVAGRHALALNYSFLSAGRMAVPFLKGAIFPILL